MFDITVTGSDEKGYTAEKNFREIYEAYNNGLTCVYNWNGCLLPLVMVTDTMNEKDFVKLCKQTVAKYANERVDKSDGKQITEDNVFVVWMCKTLQNSKALVSTTLFDGMYYELTYNGNKQELYVDAYKKWENFAVPVNG